MIFYGKIKEHKELRNNLLELISTAPATPIQKKDEYFGDDITISDWGNANDYERPWVQKLLKPFMTEMLSIIYSITNKNNS